MGIVAIILVLSSALIHAVWNLLVKQIGGGAIVVWMFTALSSVVLVPVAVIWSVVGQGGLSAWGAFFVFGTSVIHLGYFLALQRGYQTGDLSLVYPIARGIGPTLATAGAVVLLGERPTWLAVLGLGLVIVAVVLLTTGNRGGSRGHTVSAVYYGVLTGLLIGTYTIWDKVAVSRLAVSPVVLEAFAGMGIAIMLSPMARRRWVEVQEVWQRHRFAVVGVAVLAPLSYILILTAMSFTPLSYIAPAREISILFAAVLGTRFLGEGHAARRILAACSMVLGVVLLALS